MRAVAALSAMLALTAAHHTAPAAEMLSKAHASIRAADAGRHVAALADDAFEGREGGSRGGRAAGAYIVAEIERLRETAGGGLEPAGDAGSFYQAFGTMRNILVLQPGSDPAAAEELVVVGAHYDHVGYGNADNSYGPFGFVHNGADDNASGVAGLLELMEAMQQLATRPRRPILFAFWDGEEKGLLGSHHFLRVRPAAVAGKTVVFSVNLDMIGRLRGGRLEVYGTRTSPGLRSAVVRANNAPENAAGLELAFDWDVEDDSDHYPFIAAKIPTVMFHTGLHDQYHRPSDDAHLVNLDGIPPVVRLTLGFVRAVADDPGPRRIFRPESRMESNATKRRLEAVIHDAVGAHRGRWGIGTREDACEVAAPVVVRVAPGSPAATAGLLPGDRILAVDAADVANQADMVARLQAAGQRAVIDVERRGRFTRVTLEAQ
jgi:hypothetical protein